MSLKHPWNKPTTKEERDNWKRDDPFLTLRLIADVERLEQEVERLRKKYEERCWCSVSTPSFCGHKAAL